MKIFQIIIALVIGATFMACEDDLCLQGSGNLQQYDINVDDISGVALIGPINLNVSQGSAQEITVDAEPELFTELTYSVKDRVLEIGYKGNVECFDTDYGVLVNVTVPDLNYISVNGISVIKTIGELEIDKLDLSISGSAEVTLTGKAENQHIDLSGELNTYNFGFEVTNLSMDISGLANMEVNCTSAMDIEVSGSADIAYKGDPQINQNVSGSLNLTDSN